MDLRISYERISLEEYTGLVGYWEGVYHNQLDGKRHLSKDRNARRDLPLKLTPENLGYGQITRPIYTQNFSELRSLNGEYRVDATIRSMPGVFAPLGVDTWLNLEELADESQFIDNKYVDIRVQRPRENKKDMYLSFVKAEEGFASYLINFHPKYARMLNGHDVEARTRLLWVPDTAL